MKTLYLKSIIGLLCPALLFFSCAQNKDATKSKDLSSNAANATHMVSHSSKNSLDWNGVYQGVLPCADCEGIETRIVLKKDGTFQRSLTYLGKDDKVFNEEGNFLWDEQGNKITLKAESGDQKYKVGENHLTQLDMEGNLITGALADKYKVIKNKVDPKLEDKKWVLTELNGQSIENSKGFIQFNMESGRFAGNNTCNNFFGQYELTEGNRIKFGNAGSTMMACPDMELQDRFMKALEMADNYTVAENVLSLNKARMAPLAKFVLSE
jgi:heat shock protein HslJ